MIEIPTLPRAAQPFVEFPTLLRRNDFAVAPEQTLAFLEGIDLLGPGSIEDVRRAAHATLAPPPDRRSEFDALFRAFFLNEIALAADTQSPGDDDIRVQETGPAMLDAASADEINEAGQAATAAEALSSRQFASQDISEILRRFARQAPELLPRRLSRRRVGAARGRQFDLRRSLRDSVRNDGDVARLRRSRRKTRQRPVLLLIDVSGSMKAQTDQHLRLAHAMVRTVERIEVFTVGTRLTRITRALRWRNLDQALEATASTVADWDGGTRIGDALAAFLTIPRFASHTRGAVGIVLSDGLERGDHQNMVESVRIFSRRCWHLSWLSPLATRPGFTPSTAALAAIAPDLDDLGDGSSLESICRHVLAIARGAKP